MVSRETFIAIALLFAVMTPVALWTEFRPPGVTIVLLYLLLYLVVSQVSARRHGRGTEPPPQLDWPTSGPIGRYGQTGLMVAFTLSGLPALLNPFQLTQIILQAVGNLALQRRGTDASHAAAVRTKAAYTLPFAGAWLVYNGGATPRTSHSWDVLTQRYAYDFVQTDGTMRRHAGHGTALADYFCYGQEILAAAPGAVVKVQDGIRDAPFVGYGLVDFLARSFIGNHIIVRHAQGEYGLYAHLIPGSIAVAVGDKVARGGLLGRCGHSGHSSEPHLHFHLQDGPNFFFAMGLPVRFTNLRVNGNPATDTLLTAGDLVQPDQHG